MRIENSQRLRNGLVNQEAEQAAQQAPKTSPDQLKSATEDRLDLSVTARTAAVSADELAAAQASSESLSADRLAEIKARVKSGAYSADAILSKTADSLLNFYSD